MINTWAACRILVVSADRDAATQLRFSLQNIGLGQVEVSTSHSSGYARTLREKFSHVIFQARNTDSAALDFVKKVIARNKESILIALSEKPVLDEVFNLLYAGARGFLIPPVSSQTLEEVLDLATNGGTIHRELIGGDRTVAFAKAIETNFGRLAACVGAGNALMRDSDRSRYYRRTLAATVEMARVYCPGGRAKVLECLIERFIDVAESRALRTRSVIQPEYPSVRKSRTLFSSLAGSYVGKGS